VEARDVSFVSLADCPTKPTVPRDPLSVNAGPYSDAMTYQSSDCGAVASHIRIYSPDVDTHVPNPHRHLREADVRAQNVEYHADKGEF